MPDHPQAYQLASALDMGYLVDTLSQLARVPCAVEPGPEVFIEPDAPRLVRYVQGELRPRLHALGCHDITDVPRNQLLVKLGEGESDASLVVLVYVPVQHHNLMEEPNSGKIGRAAPWGWDEPCVFGQGVGQQKSGQAIMLTILKLLQEQKVKLRGTLWLAVSAEGRSSHRCWQEFAHAFPRLPQFAVLLVRTNQAISLGNRGRVDVNITVRGKASHSSAPEQGLSAINGANEAINRLKRTPLEGRHPLLGGRHAIPYQATYEPLAPHTLPHTARLRVDRRLLPGDDPDQAAADIRQAIGDLAPYDVAVERGEFMLPALVDPQHTGVLALGAAHRRVHGQPPQTVYGHGTYDAGGPCASGVPAVMYGVGGGDFPLGADFVPIAHLQNVARVMARTILDLVG